MEAQSVTIKSASGERPNALSSKCSETPCESKEDPPFFVEVSSGSGRLSAAIRREGARAYEVDITDQAENRTCIRRVSLLSFWHGCTIHVAWARGLDSDVEPSARRAATTVDHRLAADTVQKTPGVHHKSQAPISSKHAARTNCSGA